MPNDTSDQDIRRSLARAFDRAWDGYYRSGRLTVSQDIARTELARRLVQLSKEGVRDEGSLRFSVHTTQGLRVLVVQQPKIVIK
jgi:hypothetical protein